MKVKNILPIRVQGYTLKSFVNDKGEKVEFADAVILDEKNAVVECKADKNLKHLEVDCPLDGAECEFDFFEGQSKDGKKFFKLKLVKVIGFE